MREFAILVFNDTMYLYYLFTKHSFINSLFMFFLCNDTLNCVIFFLHIAMHYDGLFPKFKEETVFLISKFFY